MPDLSVIILSFNTQEILSLCLKKLVDCLEKFPGIKYEIIVVDNASTDGSIEYLKKLNYNNLKVIYNKENIGYVGGNNQALKTARGEFILFLNSDVMIEEPIDFEQLFSYLRSNNQIAALTVKVMLSKNKLDPACHRGFPTIWNSFCYFLKLEKLFGQIPIIGRYFSGYHLTYLDLDTIHEIDSPSGAFYLIKHQTLDQVGGFDNDYFMYGEDLDLSKRIKNQGNKIVYYPSFSVTHLKYQSGLNNNKQSQITNTKKHFYQAMKIFYRKHYAKRYPVLINNLIYFLVDFKQKYL